MDAAAKRRTRTALCAATAVTGACIAVAAMVWPPGGEAVPSVPPQVTGPVRTVTVTPSAPPTSPSPSQSGPSRTVRPPSPAPSPTAPPVPPPPDPGPFVPPPAC